MDYIQIDRLDFVYDINVNGNTFVRVPSYIKAYFRYKGISGRYDVECQDFMPHINEIENMIKDELGIRYPIEDEDLKESIESVLNL